MENNYRLAYEAPSVIVIEVVQEGFICVSTKTEGNPTYNPFKAEQTW